MTQETRLETVLPAIDRLLQQKDRVLVAIDGSCAAGKTTLADQIAACRDCNLIHMDSFFLQAHQRTPERLAQTGGNVDYERFLAEVLTPLETGAVFSYRPFDCGVFALADPVTVTPKRLTLVEGSYAMHPHFGDPYDLKIFLTVSPELRRERILRRPAFLHRRFFEEWIPMEERYFAEFSIPDTCDLVL